MKMKNKHVDSGHCLNGVQLITTRPSGASNLARGKYRCQLVQPLVTISRGWSPVEHMLH